MSAPGSTMNITNLDQNNSFWAAGVEIPPLANQDYAAGSIAAVCADLNFWAAFLGGVAAVKINGRGLPATTPAVVAFLIAVAIGDVVPT